ncbi:hypothetical protein Nmel_012654 [Mimus melanotis]
MFDKIEEIRTNVWQKRLWVHRIFLNQLLNARD